MNKYDQITGYTEVVKQLDAIAKEFLAAQNGAFQAGDEALFAKLQNAHFEQLKFNGEVLKGIGQKMV